MDSLPGKVYTLSTTPRHPSMCANFAYFLVVFGYFASLSQYISILRVVQSICVELVSLVGECCVGL